jgi:hypothetical protein
MPEMKSVFAHIKAARSQRLAASRSDREHQTFLAQIEENRRVLAHSQPPPIVATGKANYRNLGLALIALLVAAAIVVASPHIQDAGLIALGLVFWLVGSVYGGLSQISSVTWAFIIFTGYIGYLMDKISKMNNRLDFALRQIDDLENSLRATREAIEEYRPDTRKIEAKIEDIFERLRELEETR